MDCAVCGDEAISQAPDGKWLCQDHWLEYCRNRSGTPGADMDAIPGESTSEPVSEAPASEESEEEVDATEAAKEEAEERDIPLSSVPGTGQGGRVVVNDVRRYAAKNPGG